jgi:hypothetical protein
MLQLGFVKAIRPEHEGLLLPLLFGLLGLLLPPSCSPPPAWPRPGSQRDTILHLSFSWPRWSRGEGQEPLEGRCDGGAADCTRRRQPPPPPAAPHFSLRLFTIFSLVAAALPGVAVSTVVPSPPPPPPPVTWCGSSHGTPVTITGVPPGGTPLLANRGYALNPGYYRLTYVSGCMLWDVAQSLWSIRTLTHFSAKKGFWAGASASDLVVGLPGTEQHWLTKAACEASSRGKTEEFTWPGGILSVYAVDYGTVGDINYQDNTDNSTTWLLEETYPPASAPATLSLTLTGIPLNFAASLDITDNGQPLSPGFYTVTYVAGCVQLATGAEYTLAGLFMGVGFQTTESFSLPGTTATHPTLQQVS